MIGETISRIRRFFQPTLLDKILVEIDKARAESRHCILSVTPTDVISQTITLPANVALIHHEKIQEFQKQLLEIELKLIALNHYCIIKLAEDKSYANIFIFIEDVALQSN